MTLLEAAPPGWEDWIQHRKDEGMRTSLIYALAWKKYNEGKTYKAPKGRKKKEGKPHGKIEKVRRKRKPRGELKKKKKSSRKKLHEMSLSELKSILENAIPVNNASGGSIAGLGGSSGEPGIKKKKKKKTSMFRRTDCGC